MSTKQERIAQYLREAASTAQPGDWLASVDSLQELVEGSIGAVMAGVDLAERHGVRLERRRGPHGGYYLADVAGALSAAAGTATGVAGESWREEALVAVEAAVDALEQLRDVLQRGDALSDLGRTA